MNDNSSTAIHSEALYSLRPKTQTQADSLSRLENLETSLLSLLQEVRSIKGEIQKMANGNSTLEPLLDAEQLSKLLGVDTAYVYSQARTRKIPSIKLGKYRKFSPSQIKKWLDRKNTP